MLNGLVLALLRKMVSLLALQAVELIGAWEDLHLALALPAGRELV